MVIILLIMFIYLFLLLYTYYLFIYHLIIYMFMCVCMFTYSLRHKGRRGGIGCPSPLYFFPKNNPSNKKGARAIKRLSTTLSIGSLNVRGCSTNEMKREMIGRMFVEREIDVLALSET